MIGRDGGDLRSWCCRCGRPISRGCWRGGWTEPSCPTSNRVSSDLFRHACPMGLDGLVSKHLARSPHRVKVKNRQHPAFGRVMEQFS